MSWKNVPENILENFGFVYLITDTSAKAGEKKYYIGCKQLFSKTKRPPLKGKKRKRTVIQESTWASYYGSSNELLEAIKRKGAEHFEREILHLASCKWELKYLEMVEQIKRNVLFDEEYYNGIINLRIGKCPKNLRPKYGFV